jgi:hypothetical protein
MTKLQNPKRKKILLIGMFEIFDHYDFEFVSDFGFRHSDLLSVRNIIDIFP